MSVADRSSSPVIISQPGCTHCCFCCYMGEIGGGGEWYCTAPVNLALSRLPFPTVLTEHCKEEYNKLDEDRFCNLPHRDTNPATSNKVPLSSLYYPRRCDSAKGKTNWNLFVNKSSRLLSSLSQWRHSFDLSSKIIPTGRTDGRSVVLVIDQSLDQYSSYMQLS